MWALTVVASTGQWGDTEAGASTAERATHAIEGGSNSRSCAHGGESATLCGAAGYEPYDDTNQYHHRLNAGLWHKAKRCADDARREGDMRISGGRQWYIYNILLTLYESMRTLHKKERSNVHKRVATQRSGMI